MDFEEARWGLVTVLCFRLDRGSVADKSGMTRFLAGASQSALPRIPITETAADPLSIALP